ncbi:general stress protein [Lentilactobacillus curieae]|uniref:General stress protein n=1 Tax=Lentilactobacillus curieae TaxID=1138822 RepID=A0A1S6QFW7_9LACO|nr:CvfD/Ygs/GSP13 family RNA-binding post-transcriptional regulator [Lentilactobacillus curieae]AQW20502.1 general stress protein [Lentilactobacillus curieae]
MKPKVGMRIPVKVTGIQPYGAFVDIMGEYRGLIHISECKEGYVSDINELFTIGDVVTATIIDIDEYSGRISLSTRVNTVDFGVLDDRGRPAKRTQNYWTNYHINRGFSSIEANRNSWLSEAEKNFQ